MTFKGPGGLARPTREPFTEGHLAVGVVEEAIEDGPSEVQGPDMLIIGADAHGHGVLRRRVTCPLPLPGSGRGLVGRAVGIRHRTHDPDDMDDVRVVRWPVEVGRTLQPCRAGLEGPGAGRARAWRLLAQCSALVSVAGILLTVVSLIVLVSTAGGLFAELPAWFRSGAVLAASAGAALLGPLSFAFCDSRETAALSRSRG